MRHLKKPLARQQVAFLAPLIPYFAMNLLYRSALLCICTTAVISCQNTEYEEDGIRAPTLPAPPRQIIVKYPYVARNGVSTHNDKPLPPSYEEFRNSSDYRLTFRTWTNNDLMQSSGKKRVVIDLANQRGQCLVNDQVAMDFPVCTGTSSHHTPTGSFRISEKDVHHYSNLYDCPMPYFMRLTNGGIGLHIGDVYRVPASHGCIRMTRDACIALFNALPSGTEVTIVP